MNNLLMAQHGGKGVVPKPSMGTLTLDGYSSSYAYLGFTGSTFPGGFSSYKVYRDDVQIAIISNVGSAYYDDYQSFIADQTYTYFIRGYDQLGQYSDSNTVSFVGVETTPPTITRFDAVAESGGIRLTVEATDASGIWWASFSFSDPDGSNPYRYFTMVVGSTPSSCLIPWSTNPYAGVLQDRAYCFATTVRDYNSNDAQATCSNYI